MIFNLADELISDKIKLLFDLYQTEVRLLFSQHHDCRSN